MDPQVVEEFDPLADIRLELQMPRADQQQPEQVDAIMEEQGAEVEVWTAEAWIAWISNARARLEHDLNHHWTATYTVSTEAWLAMAVDPELRTRFIDSHINSGPHIGEFEFEFGQLAALSQRLVQASLITMNQILECTQQVAALAYSIKPPEGYTRLDIKGGLDSSVLASSYLIAAFRRVDWLILRFPPWEDVHIGALTWSLRRHPVENLRLYRATAHHLSAICPAIQTMPNIDSFSLLGFYPDEYEPEIEDSPPLDISQPQDAAVLQSVFSNNALKELSIQHLVCDNVGAASIFCLGLAASKLKVVELCGTSFPEETDELLGNALAAAPLERLDFATTEGYRVNIFKTLCRRLKDSTTIKSLSLGVWGDLGVGTSLGCDELVDILSDGLPRTIKCLTLFLKNWTHDFEKLISGYAKGETDGMRLRKLVIILDDDNWNGPPHVFETAPKAFVTAVDEEARCLEEVVVKYRFNEVNELPESCLHDITDRWVTDELGWILALNRQRRIHGHRFECIAMGETPAIRKALLEDALDHIDQPTFNGFLRRDEWCLQRQVKELLAE